MADISDKDKLEINTEILQEFKDASGDVVWMLNWEGFSKESSLVMEKTKEIEMLIKEKLPYL